MLRRLYFILPDEPHAIQVIGDLQACSVDESHVHAIAGKGVTLTQLPPATDRQRRDAGLRLERILWNANLAVFALALFGFIASLYWGFSVWSVLTLAIMILTFVGGAAFAILVPDTHLDEFRSALSHGEILLMVDVPKKRVAEIEALIERRHPEATAGGSGWTIEALGI